MKTIIILSICTFFFSGGVAAESLNREEFIKTISEAYLGTDQVTVDSPFIQEPLALAKSMNQHVKNEDWLSISDELVRAVQESITGKGSPAYESVATAVKGMSDGEVRLLASMFRDPVYRKFQKEVNSPGAKEAFNLQLYGLGSSIEAMIKKVLNMRGLRY